MNTTESRMITAICDLIKQPDFNGRKYKASNTEVFQVMHAKGRIISVRLHGNEIAAIRPDERTVWISDCGWQTKTTKSRLNAIIASLTHHRTISQRNFQWLQYVGDAAYAWKGQDIFPLAY